MFFFEGRIRTLIRYSIEQQRPKFTMGIEYRIFLYLNS